MNYLITGKNGQLAQAFMRRFERDSISYAAPDESAFDITNPDAVREGIRSSRPDIIINCAAYNFVDLAEQERDKAFGVNASGPAALASAAKQYNAFLVHFGSDYVFDGSKENGLYTEDDQTRPLNTYGESKQEGERLVRQETDDVLIFRLSWVFGEGRQNFMFKLREWAGQKDYLKIACDEFSVPTCTGMVVDITLRALKQGVSGLYHLPNTGFCSRYEWANLILDTLRIKKFIRPVSMASFNLPAKRPGFSAMTNDRIAGTLGISIPTWQDAVIDFLKDDKKKK